MENKPYEESIVEIKKYLSLFEKRITPSIDKENTSQISKIPYKLLSLRALYQIRICDLGHASLLLYTKKAYVPAFVLTRAVMETVAMFYVCFLKVSTSITENCVNKIDEFLMQALLGTRDGTGSVKHYNAVTAVQHVGKRNKAFEELYLGLCEFTHPNWAGVSLAYSEQIDEGHMELKTINDPSFVDIIGIKPLMASLMLFDELYQEIEYLIPKFTEVCENKIEY